MIDKRFEKLKKTLSDEKNLLLEIEKLNETLEKADVDERNLLNSQIKSSEKKLKELHENLKIAFTEILFSKPLEIEKKPLVESDKPEIPKKEKEEEREKLRSLGGKTFSLKEIQPIGLEKETIYKIKEREKKKKEDEKKDSSDYAKIASQLFSKNSRKLLGQKSFKKMEDELTKANLSYTPVGYVSVIILTTFISCIFAGFIFLFFLFFNFEAALPIITRSLDPINVRFMKTFWILFTVPLVTFLFMYIFPALERKGAEDSIDAELPFATIHMASIAGSMINPVKIFEIIASTKEYPALTKEFTKMINEINLYGYDLVSALNNTAKNSSSKRLAELLNGLATTISSGGDLAKFFDKRSQTLLFNYKLEQQKSSKAAETFMDMYISLVIAAPMILMLLMMIMKISGLGIAMSVNTIGLIIILGVVVINIIFLTFLHVKKSGS